MKLKKVIISTILVTSIICIQKGALATTGIVDTDTLNLRESPSTDSSVLRLLNRDEKVQILEQDGVWYKIKINGTTGYVHSDYIEKIEEEPTTSTEPENNGEDNPQQSVPENNVENTEIPEEIKIEKEVNIYILPLINSSKISKTEVGETVTVLGNTDKWIYVSAKNVNGWIIKGQVIEEITSNENNNNEGNATGNEDTQNNETSNNENSNNETNNSDDQATTENKETAITPKTMYVNSSSIYVRKGPGTNYDYIDSLILNSGVTVIAEVGDWYKVKVSGLEGYIAKRLLSNTKQDTTSRGDVVREEKEQESQNQEQQEQEEQTQATTSSTSVGNQIVEYAKQYLGCKYVYGGSGPKTFDCSGFTMYVYKNFGVSLSHSARAQSKKGTYVAKEDLRPGDIVFFKDYETMDGIGHCGIYIGNGDFIHASSGTGYCVKISTLLSGSYKTRYETARRLI